MHAPFIESESKVYTGDYLYDIPTSDVITSDKKSMIADDYLIWSVTDPLKYYQTLGAIRGRAEERIEAAVFNATKNIISEAGRHNRSQRRNINKHDHFRIQFGYLAVRDNNQAG